MLLASEPTIRIVDYNGTGEWSLARIQERYQAYCQELKVREPKTLRPLEHQENGTLWIYPLMQEIIPCIEAGEPACIAIGVDLIEEDQQMPFGSILKSNTARAVRRQTLTEAQQERIRKRVVAIYIRGKIPHEFREYNKLLKKVGLGTYGAELEARIPRDKPYAMRFYGSLKQ